MDASRLKHRMRNSSFRCPCHLPGRSFVSLLFTKEGTARPEVLLLYGYDNHLGTTKASSPGTTSSEEPVGGGTCRPRLTANQFVSVFPRRITSDKKLWLHARLDARRSKLAYMLRDSWAPLVVSYVSLQCSKSGYSQGARRGR